MENYQDFLARNINWGEGFVTEKDMLLNYEIACNVEEIYEETFGKINSPKIGDIVEFSDGFRIFTEGKITENLYGKSQYGMMSICENGSSYTDGKYFSTSGGAFHHTHKSRLVYVGEAENLVWTWGRFGAGGNQGIYFPLKVRKWIIPYEQPITRSTVKIGGESYAVNIQNTTDCMFCCQTFRTVRAFRAWAEYVGYRHESFGHGTFVRRSPQRIEDKCFIDKNWQPPQNAKPIKIIRNGKVKNAWVVSTDTAIKYFWPNIYDPTIPEPRYGSKEWQEEMKEYRKYDGNPLGV